MFAECADHRYRIRPAARSTAVHEPLTIHGQICEYLIPYTFFQLSKVFICTPNTFTVVIKSLFKLSLF